MALDRALQPLGLADDERGQRGEDDAEHDQQEREPPVENERQRQQHEQRDERGEMLAEERQPEPHSASVPVSITFISRPEWVPPW